MLQKSWIGFVVPSWGSGCGWICLRQRSYFLYVATSMTHAIDRCQGNSWKLSLVADISLLISELWGCLQGPRGGGREE